MSRFTSTPSASGCSRKSRLASWTSLPHLQTSKNQHSEIDTVVHEFDLDTPLHNIPFCESETHSDQYLTPDESVTSLVHPFKWSPAVKNLHVIVSCIACILASYGASSYSPAVDQVQWQFHVNEIVALIGITSFTVGYAATSMVLSPVSEFAGRKWVLAGSGFVFAWASLGSGLTKSFIGLMISRFFAGVGSSTFSLVTAIITDMYPTEFRNAPMSISAGCAVLGIGLGPLVCGFIAQYASWRVIFYSQAIVHGMTTAAMALFFKESRANVILTRKEKALNKWQQKQEQAGLFMNDQGSAAHRATATLQKVQWKAPNDDADASVKTMIYESTVGPFRLLFMDPVVLVFSLWATFSWAVLFIGLGAATKGFKEAYGFSLSQSNAIFAATCIGAITIGALGCYHDKIIGHFRKVAGDPEARLLSACFESFLLPVGLLIFGWTCRTGVHWIFPAIGIALASMGITTIYLAVFNYLADAYGPHASTAVAAQSFLRSMISGAFPLFTPALFRKMEYGWACTMLAGIAAILSVVPWVLVRKGPAIRRKSEFAISPGEAEPRTSMQSARGGNRVAKEENAGGVNDEEKGI